MTVLLNCRVDVCGAVGDVGEDGGVGRDELVALGLAELGEGSGVFGAFSGLDKLGEKVEISIEFSFFGRLERRLTKKHSVLM